MLVPYANTNTFQLETYEEPFSIQEASTEEFAKLAYEGNETYALLYIPIDEVAK